MMKVYTVLLACAMGAGTLLGGTAPASAARVAVVTARPAVAARPFPGHPFYRSVYYGYPYRYGYGYPYGVGVGIGVGYGYAGGYGYVGGGYGYAPYPAVYGPAPYWAYRPYWHPCRRVYWRRCFIR